MKPPFSFGEGAFFANVDGPVRAVRSYLGANSGPLTQTDHFFYAQREEMTTYTRVHALPAGGLVLLDYAPAAAGMLYSNDLQPAAVVIDGVPDSFATGALTWELITGPQGSLMTSLRVDTNVSPFVLSSYYSDDATPATVQCTGDPFEVGTSGSWVTSPLPPTDPLLGATHHLARTLVFYYDAPGATPQTAALRAQQGSTPLEVTTRPVTRLERQLGRGERY